MQRISTSGASIVVSLHGISGAGKSTLGSELSAVTGWKHIEVRRVWRAYAKKRVARPLPQRMFYDLIMKACDFRAPGLIIDGFPRDGSSFKYFNRHLAKVAPNSRHFILFLDIPIFLAGQRVAKRHRDDWNSWLNRCAFFVKCELPFLLQQGSSPRFIHISDADDITSILDLIIGLEGGTAERAILRTSKKRSFRVA